MDPALLYRFVEECWRVLHESAIFVLTGFLLAALIHAWVRPGRLARALSKPGWGSVLTATAIGVPMPLCSCGALPVALALRRQGASKGAVLSFLISEPETSTQSILMTYGLLGPLMAIVRPIAACFAALTAGLLENVIDRRWPSGEPATADHVHDACGDDHVHDLPLDQSAGAVASRGRYAEGLRYAFGEIFDEVAGWMWAGVLVAAAINVFAPDWLFAGLADRPWLAMFVMLAVGIPLYVCAEASTPIAAAFILQGINPGAALVFLLTGPATNFGTIVVLWRQLGRRTIVVYLSCIAVVSLAAGMLLNVLVARYGRIVPVRPLDEAFVPTFLKAAGVVVFVLISLASFRRQHVIRRASERVSGWLPLRPAPRLLRVVALLALIAAYGLSGFAVVGPDEVGLQKRFGKLVNEEKAPGLYWVWPFPVGSMTSVPAASVRRLELGQSRGPDGKPLADETSGWIWLGDENVASIRYSVHYAPQPGFARLYAFSLRDPEALVRVAALSACRETLSRASIDTIYTTGRPDAEKAVLARMQSLCDRADSGVLIRSFRLIDVHAPAEVHEAFRDVASALEDRATQIDRADAERARIIPVARGEAALRLAEARAAAGATVAAARGAAGAFRQTLEAAASCPGVTRLRLYYEMLDAVLPKVRKILRASDGHGRPLELWMRGGAGPLPPPPVEP